MGEAGGEEALSDLEAGDEMRLQAALQADMSGMVAIKDGEEALSDLDTALLDEAGDGALSDLDQPLQDDVAPEANDEDMSEMIEIDTYGEVDMENELAVSDSGVDIVDLSSDEEEVQEDVSLVLLKRPPVMESHDATIDILDSDEEFPVCVAEGEKPVNTNYVEKTGRLEEYIEREGLGIIFAEDYGLVLFHLSQVWVDGTQLGPTPTRERIRPGTRLSFYDQTLQGEEYKVLSTEKILHQALVVWAGERPDHLMKNLGHSYLEKLVNQRKNFLVYVTGQVFLPCDLVRVKGVVRGYINPWMGIIECNVNRDRVNVFLHVEDVLIFREPLRDWERRYECSPSELLPVGLSVSVDARRVKIPGVTNLQHQAITVLAGSWPSSLPVLLPGGPGTTSQAFDVPPDMTFYYLELCRDAKLADKLESLREELGRTSGEVVFMRNRSSEVIRGGQDLDLWRRMFTNKPKRPRPRGEERGFSRDVRHTFRAPPARVIKTKKEDDDSSSLATAGGTGGSVCSLSEVSSHMSRPVSRLSSTSSCHSSKSRRSWYNPDYWSHGGLRIKQEIKTEEDRDWEPPVKRFKTEKGSH